MDISVWYWEGLKVNAPFVLSGFSVIIGRCWSVLVAVCGCGTIEAASKWKP